MNTAVLCVCFSNSDTDDNIYGSLFPIPPIKVFFFCVPILTMVLMGEESVMPTSGTAHISES